MAALLVILFVLLTGRTVTNEQLPAEYRRILDHADSAVLFSLEPLTPPPTNGATLHYFKILGQTTLDPV
jgi:hypothetical protein